MISKVITLKTSQKLKRISHHFFFKMVIKQRKKEHQNQLKVVNQVGEDLTPCFQFILDTKALK